MRKMRMRTKMRTQSLQMVSLIRLTRLIDR